MTNNVKNVLDKISLASIFDDELYFTGGTALAYYLNHRVSEDIDIVSSRTLNHKNIIANILLFGAIKIQDENITALRIAGLFPDEYIIKFTLDKVLLEFFQANRPIQKDILKKATFAYFENTKLKILDIKSTAKLKLVALVLRDKSRDLYDFKAILENNLLSNNEIIDIFYKTNSNIKSLDDIINFIKIKKEPINDEAVYLDEENRISLSFKEIKEATIKVLNSLVK